MSNGVTTVLCGAHAELKSAVQGFEEMKALVMTPAIGSMHVQQGVAVASSVVLVVQGSTNEDTVSMATHWDIVPEGGGLVKVTVVAEGMGHGGGDECSGHNRRVGLEPWMSVVPGQRPRTVAIAPQAAD